MYNNRSLHTAVGIATIISCIGSIIGLIFTICNSNRKSDSDKIIISEQSDVRSDEINDAANDNRPLSTPITNGYENGSTPAYPSTPDPKDDANTNGTTFLTNREIEAIRTNRDRFIERILTVKR